MPLRTVISDFEQANHVVNKTKDHLKTEVCNLRPEQDQDRHNSNIREFQF